jgi:hypothetical protein
MLGKNFVDKCLNSKVLTDPWPHTVTENHLDQKEFNSLLNDCNRLLEIKLKDMPIYKGVTENHIIPQHFKDFNINWYDQILDISKNIYENRKKLCDVFLEHRWVDDLIVTAYVGVTPPAPYSHILHQETISKIWSSVTYITPEKNCGTKMYTEGKKESLVKEAQWKPNSTMIFAGIEGKTWHSYNSTEESNRITLNFFIKNKEGLKEYFYP